MLLTRPVSSAYRFAAAVRLFADAPGKLALVNSPLAGSLLSTPKLIVGSSDEFLAQTSYCVNDPPRLRLCDPRSSVTVSSSSSVFALRDCGDAVAPGLVRFDPTLGNVSW